VTANGGGDEALGLALDGLGAGRGGGDVLMSDESVDQIAERRAPLEFANFNFV